MKILCLLILLSFGQAKSSSYNTTYSHPDNNTLKNETHNNSDKHSNDSVHKESHLGHGEPHGIHLASINYDYVKSPLLITVFLFAAGICKLGKSRIVFNRNHFISFKRVIY